MAGYGDDTKFNAWLGLNGYSLPAGAPAPAILRQRGSAYIDATYGARFIGQPTGGYEQERAWPRTGAYPIGAVLPIPDNVIPIAVEQASYEAAYYEAVNPGSLVVGGSLSGAVKREKVDVIEVEYQTSSNTDFALMNGLMITAVEGLLAPFLFVAQPGFGLWAVGTRADE